MNRRNFLRLSTAVVAAAALPAIPDISGNPLFSGAPIQWDGLVTRKLFEFDHGHRLGIGLQTYINGERYRMGSHLENRVWSELTKPQQEALWAALERRFRAWLKQGHESKNVLVVGL